MNTDFVTAAAFHYVFELVVLTALSPSTTGQTLSNSAAAVRAGSLTLIHQTVTSLLHKNTSSQTS